MIKNIIKELVSKENLKDYLLIALGCLVQAVGMVVFMVPANLISGGISGLAQVINHFSGLPIGLMTLLGNIPVLILGWRYLGRLPFAIRTVMAILLFSVFTDLIYFIYPDPAITNDIFLNTVFGAVIMGLGFGLVYLGGGTSGGSDIIGRILNQRLGISISNAFLFTDSVIIILGAVVFGWELGLYAMIVVYISGKAAELISEGRNSFRQAYIISSAPDVIADRIMKEMEHGVTILHGAGAYSREEKEILYLVFYPNELNELKKMVAESDPKAFMIVGQANEVLGEGFLQNKYYE